MDGCEEGRRIRLPGFTHFFFFLFFFLLSHLVGFAREIFRFGGYCNGVGGRIVTSLLGLHVLTSSSFAFTSALVSIYDHTTFTSAHLSRQDVIECTVRFTASRDWQRSGSTLVFLPHFLTIRFTRKDGRSRASHVTGPSNPCRVERVTSPFCSFSLFSPFLCFNSLFTLSTHCVPDLLGLHPTQHEPRIQNDLPHTIDYLLLSNSRVPACTSPRIISTETRHCSARYFGSFTSHKAGNQPCLSPRSRWSISPLP